MRMFLPACLAVLAAVQAQAQVTPNQLAPATTPAKTDAIPCQPSPGTPGSTKRCSPEQIIQAAGSPTVSAVGMVSGGADNSPYADALNMLLSPTSNVQSTGNSVLFPADPTKNETVYYFSSAFDLRRAAQINCAGTGVGSTPAVSLVFAAGVDGVVFHSNTTAPAIGGGIGRGEIANCGIKSLGMAQGNPTRGSATIDNVVMQTVTGLTTPGFAVGDGVVAIQRFLISVPGRMLAVPPGAEVGAVSGSSITLANGAVVDADTTTNPNQGLSLYRLPATLAATVNTTAGSSTVYVVGGTTRFYPGDLVWHPGFPFMTRVLTATGATGAQTLVLNNYYLTAAQNATLTTSNAKMWRVPAGIRRLIYSNTRGVTLFFFPIGLDMPCTGNGGINCTSSKDYSDFTMFSIIGRAVTGNNTGASTDYGSVFANNYFADILEGGTIGSAYIGTNSNSGESHSNQPIVGNCANQNSSSFVGVYAGGGGWKYCLTGGSTSPMFYAPQAGFPLDAVSQDFNGLSPRANGSILFKNPMSGNITAATYDSGTGETTLTLDRSLSIPVGGQFDLTNLWGTGNPRSFFPAGSKTAITGTSGNVVKFTAPAGLTAVIQGGTVLYKTQAPCVGLHTASYTLAIASNCNNFNPTATGFQLQTNGALDLVVANSGGGHVARIGGPAYTSGYPSGYYFGVPNGLLLGAVPSAERLLANASSRPVSTFNKRGDVYLNQAASAGGAVGWADTADGANFLPFGLISNDVNGLSWNVPITVSTGTKPTNAGTCNITSVVGGAAAGSFRAASGCAPGGTVKLTFAQAAPNGFRCTAANMTTPANMMVQTAYDTGTCTLTGTMAANDNVVYSAVAF